MFLIEGFPAIPEHHKPHPDLVPEGQRDPEEFVEGRQEVARGRKQEVHRSQRRKGFQKIFKLKLP